MRISDWSSDVCSSDLGEHGAVVEHERRDIAFGGDRAIIRAVGRNLGLEIDALVIERQPGFVERDVIGKAARTGRIIEINGLSPLEIGRGSCRERVCQYV